MNEAAELVNLDLLVVSCKLGQVAESQDRTGGQGQAEALGTEGLGWIYLSGGRPSFAGEEAGLWAEEGRAGPEEEAWKSEEETGGPGASRAGAEAEGGVDF